jgi:hypothetical protein
MTEIELAERDFNKFTALARLRRPAASLSEATGGDLDRSLRHRELKRPNGFGDELRVALVCDTGTCGGVTLMREAGRANFEPADAAAVASLARHVVDGIRWAMLLGEAPPGGEDRDELGLVVLAEDDSIVMTNGPALEWLDELGDDEPDGPLPAVIRAVARRARPRPGSPRARASRAVGCGRPRAGGCSCADRCSGSRPS